MAHITTALKRASKSIKQCWWEISQYRTPSPLVDPSVYGLGDDDYIPVTLTGLSKALGGSYNIVVDQILRHAVISFYTAFFFKLKHVSHRIQRGKLLWRTDYTDVNIVVFAIFLSPQCKNKLIDWLCLTALFWQINIHWPITVSSHNVPLPKRSHTTTSSLWLWVNETMRGGLAQSVECSTCNTGVPGSNPTRFVSGSSQTIVDCDCYFNCGLQFPTSPSAFGKMAKDWCALSSIGWGRINGGPGVGSFIPTSTNLVNHPRWPSIITSDTVVYPERYTQLWVQFSILQKQKRPQSKTSLLYNEWTRPHFKTFGISIY